MLEWSELAVGDRLRIRDRDHVLKHTHIDGVGAGSVVTMLRFEDLGRGRSITFAPEELSQLYCDRELEILRSNVHERDRYPTDVSPIDDTARKRLLYVDAMDRVQPTKNRNEVEALIDKVYAAADFEHKKPSWESVIRWTRERSEPGRRDPKSMRNRHRRGPKGLQQPPEVLEVYERHLRAHFENPVMKPAGVHALVSSDIREINRSRAAYDMKPFRIPCAKTTRNYIAQQTDYENTKRRHGTAVANRMFKPVFDGMAADRLAEIVQIDHTVLDCVVFNDEAGGEPAGRPTIAAAIDLRSRAILAAIVGFEPPSLSTVSALLRSMVTPKLDLPHALDEHSKLTPFMPAALPQTIVADNALENVGRSFPETCTDWGIHLDFTGVGKPEEKGVIERWFRRLNEDCVHSLPGAVPSKPHELKEIDYDPAKHARLTLSELREEILRYIALTYHSTPHQTLKSTPRAVWEERFDKDRPMLPSSLSEFEASLGINVSRSLSRRGIFVNDLRYCSNDVFSLLDDLLPGSKKAKQKNPSVDVTVRYLSDDLSAVFVLNHVRNQYVRIPCLTEGYDTPISLHQHKTMKRWIAERGADSSSEAELAAERAHFERRVQEMLRDKKMRTRTQAARLANGGSGKNTGQQPTGCPPSHLPAETMSQRVDGNKPEKAPTRAKTRSGKRKTPRRRVEDKSTAASTAFASNISYGDVEEAFQGILGGAADE